MCPSAREPAASCTPWVPLATKRSEEQNAASLRTQGLIQPITVRPNSDGYEIVAGARRFRAARLAELTELPVRIVQLSDEQSLAWQIIENSQRVDVHPYEEAQGLRFILHLVVGSVYKLVSGFSSAVFAILAA
jgi:ParB family transcriptional regulator, chromosome partitioning protein